jgi:hypothetical protein
MPGHGCNASKVAFYPLWKAFGEVTEYGEKAAFFSAGGAPRLNPLAAFTSSLLQA